MKVIPMDQAKDQLAAICELALSGEIIRVQSKNGQELELTPVSKIPNIETLSPRELAACYNDSDWAAFENQTGKASD